MRIPFRFGLCSAFLLGLLAFSTSPALAASPWWHFTSSVRPSTLKPGGEGIIGFRALNVGDAPTSFASEGKPTPVILTATLPAGVTIQKSPPEGGEPEKLKVTVNTFPENQQQHPETCSEPAPREVRCIYEPPLVPYEYVEMSVTVNVDSGVPSGALSTAEVTGGGAPVASLQRPLVVGEAPPAFGVEEQGFSIVPEEEGGAVDARAGSHPFQLTTNFVLNQNPNTLTPPALTKDLKFTLPPGLVANAAVFPRCTELEFLSKGLGTGLGDLCPQEAAVGVVLLSAYQTSFGTAPVQTYPVPVFNLTPNRGEPVRFGFYFAGIPVPIDFSVRTGGDYGATATVSNITQVANFISESLTIWGVPGEPVHDESRGYACLARGFYQFRGTPPCNTSTQKTPPPFLTLPTSCATPFAASVEGDSWPLKTVPGAAPGSIPLPAQGYSLKDSLGRTLGITGCNKLSFNPFIEVAPDVQETSTSTGLTVHVRVPQEVSENASGLASSSVKDITVALPEGVAVNPAGGNGLAACSESLVGFETARGEGGFEEFNPVTEPGSKTALFTPRLPGSIPAMKAGEAAPLQPGVNFCATGAKIGTVDIASPLLPATQHLKGAVYLASQNENPFGSLIAMYIVAEDPQSGVLIKLPGEVHLSETGQIVATFHNSPQLPFEDAELHFFGGERAPLATPSHCGTYTTNATFAPWSGSEPVSSRSQFDINAGPEHGPCPSPSLPFSPSLTGGSTNDNAAAFSPLTTTIGREDGNQDMQSVHLHFPPGLSGLLTGVRLCPEAQANEGTCGPESLIGETTITAGVGSDPVSVTGGRVYITEKYAGAPFGLSIANPVKAGPFDLEHDTSNPTQRPPCDCVVVRAKIEVDPHTAALTVTTDRSGPHAIPHLIDGIPVQIKKVNVLINRAGFTFNPTNCNKMSITGSIASDEGASSEVSVPFQATNCAVLKFAPKFVVSTSGKTSRAKGASLTANLSYPNAPQGTQANITRVKVDLPKQLPSRLTTLQKACTAAQFELNPADCPAASKIGYAIVHTPLLPVRLEGPAIFVSHGGEAFPSLTMVLQGYGVTVDLVGTTYISKKGITSTTFKTVPDVPFNTFQLTLPQGKFSALAANGNLCKSKLAMPTEFLAQNGAKINESTKIGVTGCKRHVRHVRKKNHRKKK